MTKEFDLLVNEDISKQEECSFCSESNLELGKKTDYGSRVIYQIGSDDESGWFATLSPQTGNNAQEDFTLQLMPKLHLTHFSQMATNKELSKNFGIAFSRLMQAMTKIMTENEELKSTADKRDGGIAISSYGKCTTWEEKKEHLHIKIFPFRGNLSQPFTVDSSFGKKEIHSDTKTGKNYVKMTPIKKLEIDKNRFEYLTENLLKLLKK